jgi:very-short-patch-repair endonuclease
MKLSHRTPIKKLSNVKNNDMLELPFAQYLAFNNVKFVRQFKPIKDRKYKVDFFLPEYNVIIEIEGGQWINGRHQRGIGFKVDIEKYNTITMAGYTLYRLTTDHFLKVGLKQYACVGYSANLVKHIMEIHENRKNS